MKLRELFQDVKYILACGDPDATVTGITCDSRKAAAGQIFACLTGVSTDGHDFAADAYANGARVFLAAHMPEQLTGLDDVTVAVVEDTRAALALISTRFFGFPAKRLKFIGITGTKGKTTISFMLKAIFEDAGKRVGLIGSNGVFYGDVWYKLPNTTPESCQLQEILRDMADDGVEYCFIEATSQGFFLHRTDGIKFDLALYTNISRDHISATEHPDFQHYFDSKQKIFTQTDCCFVNRDDPLFDDITTGAPCEIRTFGTEENANYRAANIRSVLEGNRMRVTFDCRAPGWELSFSVGIPGKFNAYNALAAICIADYFGIPKESIRSGAGRALIRGRMELIDAPAPYTILIDFAHNKLSVEAMMETAREYNPKRIICVFGLEGDRAHIRRFDSGEILGRTADVIILANASPRKDDPAQILADIATGVRRSGGDSITIPDRREAILHALSIAKEGDLLLLVGKGNVLYEEVHGVNIPFSEREVVEEYFAGRGSV